jgi:hypothetical protein
MPIRGASAHRWHRLTTRCGEGLATANLDHARSKPRELPRGFAMMSAVGLEWVTPCESSLFPLIEALPPQRMTRMALSRQPSRARVCPLLDQSGQRSAVRLYDLSWRTFDWCQPIPTIRASTDITTLIALMGHNRLNLTGSKERLPHRLG